MKAKPATPPPGTGLRRRAEAKLRKRPDKKPAPVGAKKATTDSRRLLHELQVHQIELEMQNEELRKTRDEMEAGLKRYSDLYDFAPVGYLTLDHAGAIREANLAAAGLLGVPRAELVNLRLETFIAPADRPVFESFLRAGQAQKERNECEVKFLVKGKPPVEARLTANGFESGRACRVAVSDITRHKQAEADRLIVEKLESTGILAGGIAHDFNNQLTAILLNLELARMLPPSAEEKLAGYLQDAEKAVLLAHDLTQQIITFADGGMPVRKPSRLADMIREAARLALNNTGVRCEFFLAEEPGLLPADNGQLGQVIRNLIVNAQEAMPAGGMISVRMEPVGLVSREIPSLPAGDYIRISIADRGAGIPREVLPKIFDPYFSTKQRGDKKGMGLGLTICHAVVRKHGGAICVNSEVNVGTTFHIFLPASDPATGGAKPPRPDGLSHSAEPRGRIRSRAP